MKIQAINTNSQSNHTTNFKAKPIGLAKDVLSKALTEIYSANSQKILSDEAVRRVEIDLTGISRFGKSYGLKIDATEDVTKNQHIFYFANEFVPQSMKDICKISKSATPIEKITTLRDKLFTSLIRTHMNNNSSKMRTAQFFETYFA